MNKHIFKYLALAATTLLLGACNNESVSDLLEVKAYFNESEQRVTIEGQSTMEVPLVSRISKHTDADVNVSYSICDPSVIEEYNMRNGTDYLPFDVKDVKMETQSSTVAKGDLFSKSVQLSLSNLDKLKEGKNYMLPIQISSNSIPTISGNNIEYVILAKPIRIMKVGIFENSYVKIPFPPAMRFSSFTYEAIIYDHVAVSYDVNSGKAYMYRNGVKWSESTLNVKEWNPTADGTGFCIGRLKGNP